MTKREPDYKMAFDGVFHNGKPIHGEPLFMANKFYQHAETIKRALLIAEKLTQGASVAMLDGEARDILLDDRLTGIKRPKSVVLESIWDAMRDAMLKEIENAG